MSLELELDELIAELGKDFANYVRGSVQGLGKPPVGWGLPSPHILSVGSTQISTNGAVRFAPWDVPANCVWDGISVWQTGAASSEGNAQRTLGLYRSIDETVPDLNGGLLRSGAIPIASGTGHRIVDFEPIALKAGRYWGAFLQYFTVAPTTHISLSCGSNALRLPLAIRPGYTTSVNQQNSGARWYSVTGQSTLPNALANPNFVPQGDSATPDMMLLRAA